MEEGRKASSEAFNAWTRLHALRALILSLQHEGVSDSDIKMVQARQQQRVVAEDLVRMGEAKGIILDGREGDRNWFQRAKIKIFGKVQSLVTSSQPQELLDLEEGKPPPQIIKMKSLSFMTEAGVIEAGTPQPSQTVALESLSIEGKTGRLLNRNQSVLEGTLGVDYVYDHDPDSGETFYVPITRKGK